jgi:SWI/SNF-related matrix-associated actin-dependent regulator 1 of chromatin subfamily A
MIIRFKDNVFKAISRYEEKDELKSAGFLWNPVEKIWWTKFPENALKLSKYMDSSAIVEARRIISERNTKIEESKKIDSDFIVPVPQGKELYPFQRAGVEFLYKRGNVLLADEMGLGKTVQAIGYINVSKPNHVLIICPAVIKNVWHDMLKEWLVEIYEIAVVNGNTELIQKDKQIIVINYDIVKKYFPALSTFGYDLAILDESHYIKNRKAQRTKYTISLIQNAKKRILLSGTPVMNRPDELFMQLVALGHQLGNSFWSFANKFLITENNGYGMQIVGYNNLEILQNILRESVMLRRTKDEVLAELPAKTRQVIVLKKSDVIKDSKFYKETEETLNNYKAIDEELAIAEKDNFESRIRELKRMKSDMEIGEIAIQRRVLAEEKVPSIVLFIEDILEQEPKVVVFGHHVEAMKRIAENFGESAFLLTGETLLEERSRLIKEFQENDGKKVFVASMQAGGVGITLTAARIAVFIEMDWNPAIISQAEDRIHRIGQKDNVIIYYVIVDETIDKYMADKVLEKQKMMNEVLSYK